MACNQTLAGIPRDCEPSMGGVKRVLLNSAENITGVTVSDDQISAISGPSSTTPGSLFKEFLFRAGTASMTSTWQVSLENGTRYVQTDLAMQYSAMTTAKRVELEKVINGDTVAIVEDMNGRFWYLGKDEPLAVSAGDGGTGTARGDRNGYGITLQDNSKSFPIEVDPDIIEDLL